MGTVIQNVREFNVPVLMYHHVHPICRKSGRTITMPLLLFEQHLDELCQRGYQTVTLATLLKVVRGNGVLPRKPVVLTFDDGYESFYRFVYPALTVRRMVGSVFIVTDQIDGTNDWDTEIDHFPVRLMSLSQIREVLSGGMEVGLHGHRHVKLTRCTPEERRDEIITGTDHFKARLGMSPQVYCYAYGEFTADCFEILAEMNYLGAAAIWTSYRCVTSHPFALRRISVHEGDTSTRLRMKLSPLYLLYRAWLDRRNLGRNKMQNESS